ncbi:type IV toxin-antitoxin system AbiEi family antitoxin [Prosthecochloris sp. SCSIO W1103]|uniref:type IV toxin-antitoxin system AbiEi family antitoxin n=1 Tax=Prosthecochloris sp. SCSIO W1103 TaxID=2992244 RepID=UPI00223CC204|nr:type IV toxin-antitoxin system AbiEi family antitoxin [Prosthecochloris sp. SCSIO W1103]UZJ36855.1 type IV toxin-antitoxin system AbiEi family antitoxin [Prosthecochloris sp. SCSIO W1103]
MKLSQYIDDLQAKGSYCFSGEEVDVALESSTVATRAALRRLKQHGAIAMPFRGFYVIVPPEYRQMGCLPANQFIPELMEYLKEPYYAGILSAGEFYGAAHQRPQAFQVVTEHSRSGILCGTVKVDFIKRKNAAMMPTREFNTPRGYLKVSTPEVTAFDVVGYPHHAGGLDNTATVLAELAESLDAEKLIAIAGLSPITWSQRLGYLLELIGETELPEGLASYVAERKPVPAPLSPSRSYHGVRQNPRWRLLPNEKVSPDL